MCITVLCDKFWEYNLILKNGIEKVKKKGKKLGKIISLIKGMKLEIKKEDGLASSGHFNRNINRKKNYLRYKDKTHLWDNIWCMNI